MSGPVVIGIVGRKHHGKTTCANMIARIYSGEVQSLAFADILKSSLAILSGDLGHFSSCFASESR